MAPRALMCPHYTSGRVVSTSALCATFPDMRCPPPSSSAREGKRKRWRRLKNPSTPRAGVLITAVNLERRQQLSGNGKRHSAGPQLYNQRKMRAWPRVCTQNMDTWVVHSRKGYGNHFPQNEWFGVYICDRIHTKKAQRWTARVTEISFQAQGRNTEIKV